ncbi:MAG: L,D-transpeptidase family protein [Pseudomonadota bacterium]
MRLRILPRSSDLVVGRWSARFRGRRFVVSVGRSGIVPFWLKREGDGTTPAGVYRLLWLYGRPDRLRRPPTILPVVPLGPRRGWSEDQADPSYNRPVLLPHAYPCDRMRRGDGLYDLCAVTSHNRPAVPGFGSAIFVHCWRRPRFPTAGCVAFDKGDLAWILARWAPHSRLVVLD